MTEEKKWIPTICVDFDGTIHAYTSGWKGAGNIPDPPVEGALEWLVDAVFDGVPKEARDALKGTKPARAKIVIYSSRSKEPEGVIAMKAWLVHWVTEKKLLALPHAILHFLDFPTRKPAAIMTIDDRAHCFMGRFRPLEWYLNFKPWNKRPPEENVCDYAQPGYEKDWNQDDEDLADQTLECLLDNLATDKDGFFTFEPSALEYMAAMFMEARKNADLSTTRVKKSVFPEGRMGDLREMFFEVLQRPSINSKCLDNQDERDAIAEELLEAMRRFT